MSKKNRKILYLLLLILLLFGAFYFRIRLVHGIEIFSYWAYPNEKNRNGEITKLIINITCGIVILIGLRAALIRATASQKGVEIQAESIKNQTNQIELARNSQTNDQFKNAVEHLGSEKESIILGGISELHFIASENQEKFNEVVLNILCSKVRSEASIQKDASTINKTIVQTIINYVYKTNTYKGLSTDLSYCNLNGFNLDDTEIVNANLSFSIVPWSMKNIKFFDCNLGGVSSSLGRFDKINFLRCQLFGSFFQSAEFKDVKIYNEDASLQNITCLDSKFERTMFHCDIHKSKFIACEFENVNFEIPKILSVDFSGSSFHDINFGKTELTYCNFSGCGFVNVRTNSWIQSCVFVGIKNDYKYYSLFLEKQLNSSISKTNDFSGLNYNSSLFILNEISELNKENKIKLLKNYNEILEKQNEKMKRIKNEKVQ